MENNIIEDNILTIDSTDSRMKIISIEGNEKQYKQDGTSNLLVLEEGNKTVDGVDFSIQNGMVSISGTATANINTVCGKTYLYEGETYYIDRVGSYSNLRI